ncbi:MAG: transglycosylase SLT domain-containing protein [Campylobacterota bacterium]|nr:transglycosylase SLT domain-containing protein [Campylobacterota bacterium]
MKYTKRFLVFLLLLHTTAYAISLEHKYPSYSYVFNEFDVDESYMYDEGFISFILKHEVKLKRFYQNSLVRGKDLLPTLQGLLVDEGISDLFIYLSMVESGLSSNAVSPKKAVGLWQFMPATAKQYNLEVCSSYDERCDTVFSTTAAIRYLNKLHKQFGKWYLAALAYNCGEGCVSRAIKRARSDELSILIDENAKYLPAETRAYIKKILLVAMIGESAILDDSDDADMVLREKLISVDVSGGTLLKDIATSIKMEEKALLKLNTSFKNGVVPKEKKIYKMTIPIEKVYAFYMRYALPPAKKSTTREKSHMISHYVALGETLESIASLYQADVQEIMHTNHLENTFLVMDSLLVIPVTQKQFDAMAK